MRRHFMPKKVYNFFDGMEQNWNVRDILLEVFTKNTGMIMKLHLK